MVWFELYARRVDQRLPCPGCGNEVFVLHSQVERGGPVLVDSAGVLLNGGPVTVLHLECTACARHFVRRDQRGYESELDAMTAHLAAQAVDVTWIDREDLARPVLPTDSPRPAVDIFAIDGDDL
jgi:hypothetical protein